MARIPDSEVERIKREVSVEGLVRARGIALKRHGADLLGLCPLHDDHKPSLVVSPAKNLWHCLGACQTGGSVIDWVMKAEGLAFREAVERLRREIPSLAASPVQTGKCSAVKRPSALAQLDAEDEQLLGKVIAHYHDCLRECPEALAYLEKRGLKHDEMLGRFRLGYANGTLAARFDELQGRLRKLGLLRESGQEHFAGSLIVPVVDEEGRVTEVYGRKIHGDRQPVHLYLPGPHAGVFNAEALAESKEIILCEAVIDALTFWCAGYRNVTASYGVEGFTADHLAAFRRHGTQRVLIAYDRDEAGDRAAGVLARKLLASGIGCYRVEFPRGMDANEYALKVRPAEKSLELVIRKATRMGNGKAPSGPMAPATKGEKGPSPSLAAAPEAREAARERVPEPRIVLPAEVKPDEVTIDFEDRRYRIRGLRRNLSLDQLRVNLLCARGETYHVDTLDLYSARQRAAYLKQAATELQVDEEMVKNDLAKLVSRLEELLEAQIRKASEAKAQGPAMSEAERAEAMALLKDPKLLERILADFARCGVVGEETSKLVGYLAAISRKLEDPLAVVIQSSSAAGKTSLLEAILAFLPPEDRVKYSAMTGQSLFYMGEKDLKHKVLAVVEEAGAERASYALKLLQSEGELTIASTGKDPTTGKLVTYEYRVEGPVMILLTTTAVDVDEELLNRCLVLTVNESREQTRAIHKLQRESQTIEGLLARQDRERILRVHRNAHRLLRPLLVANPHAHELTFLDDRTRTRRDHVKYLTLIRTIALLHQYQRRVKTIEHDGKRIEYIEATLEDIALANRLAHEVLGRSLDELAPQTRRLLMLLEEMVTAECERRSLERSEYRFTRRGVREYTGWGNTQLKVHLHRLEELEYLAVHRGERGRFFYELVYDGKGKDGTPFLAGLIDAENLLRSGSDANRSGSESQRSGSGRPLVGARSGGGREPDPAEKLRDVAQSATVPSRSPQNAHQGETLPSLAAGAARSAP